MKFLGIDYGMKRIGLAISDEGGRLAFPEEVMKNNSESLRKIGETIAKERVSEIVVGESLDFEGVPNAIMKEIEFFIKNLERKFKLPVHREKEFFTTVEARGRAGKEILSARKTKKAKSTPADASAAALILQRYLDRRNVIIKK